MNREEKFSMTDIFVILEFIEFCQHARGFYRQIHCIQLPKSPQPDLTPGNQCRQRPAVAKGGVGPAVS